MRRHSSTARDAMIPKGNIASIPLVLGILLPTCGPTGVAAMRHNAVLPFEEMEPADLTRAGIRGTGCVWMIADSRSIRFAASDDRRS